MPAFIVKQPNGLLARFSTIVDDFTHYGMTRAEALAVCRVDMGIADAEAKVARGEADDMEGMGGDNPSPDGLNRWRDCVNTIRICHGAPAARQRVREILGDAQDPAP
jgi:imidazolonepropionase-like amidohydrolase